MTIDQNREIVRRSVAEIFVDGRRDAVDELVADEFTAHTWGNAFERAGLKAAMERVRTGPSAAEFTIDDMIAEGDRVAVRLTATATQVGEFMDLPATGRSCTIGEIHIFRIRDGQVVEHWHQFDQMGMLRQLGATVGRA